MRRWHKRIGPFPRWWLDAGWERHNGHLRIYVGWHRPPGRTE